MLTLLMILIPVQLYFDCSIIINLHTIYKLIPHEPYYGPYSIDVENCISQNHTFLLIIPNGQFFN